MSAPEPKPLLQLDLRAIVRARLSPRARRLLPGFLFSPLERLVCQRQLNAVLRDAWPAEGCAFARRALELLGVSLRTEGLESLPEGRYLFASNHPLGGLDGLALIAAIGSRFGDDNVRFPVNDLLMNVRPMEGVFVPVNKYSLQGRAEALGLGAVFASGNQVAIFPAGLVSRLGDDGRVADLEWKKTFAAKALESGRGVVPVRIEALNRRRFYRLARLRKKLGLKVNLEQALLPSELCHSQGMEILIRFGKPESAESLRERFRTPAAIARHVRGLSDAMAAEQAAGR